MILRRTLLTLVLGLPLAAQIDPFFQSREALAPPQVKTRLTAMRKMIEGSKLRYQVGFTGAMERPLDRLAGFRESPQEAAEARAWAPLGRQLLELDRKAEEEFLRKSPSHVRAMAPSSALATFDWRRLGKVPPIRDQGGCGSCWAFAAAGSYETSHLIRNNFPIDTSEQALLSCSKSGTCNGGGRVKAYKYMISHGNCSEKEWPYAGADLACRPHGGEYKAAAWGLVDEVNPQPTVAQLKQAIVQHGPISVACYATESMQAYTSGVFQEKVASEGGNHMVVLVGWDDAKGAWIMRNSWGTTWGETCGYGSERGYMWIAYDSSNVGRSACWVRAASMSYPLSAASLQLLKQNMALVATH